MKVYKGSGCGDLGLRGMRFGGLIEEKYGCEGGRWCSN